MIVGLTGGFGTGKSFVASVFKVLSAKVIDADEIAHEALKRNSKCYKKIVHTFGKGILDRKGVIDRKRLAGLVFCDKKKLKTLNKILHPQIIYEIEDRIRRYDEKGLIVIDAPLLIEAGLLDLVDKLIVVKASRRNQVMRALKKSGIKKEDILRRIRCQIPLARKIRMADFVIDNDGTKLETKRQVKEILRTVSCAKARTVPKGDSSPMGRRNGPKRGGNYGDS